MANEPAANEPDLAAKIGTPAPGPLAGFLVGLLVGVVGTLAVTRFNAIPRNLEVLPFFAIIALMGAAWVVGRLTRQQRRRLRPRDEPAPPRPNVPPDAIQAPRGSGRGDAY